MIPVLVASCDAERVLFCLWGCDREQVRSSPAPPLLLKQGQRRDEAGKHVEEPSLLLVQIHSCPCSLLA